MKPSNEEINIKSPLDENPTNFLPTEKQVHDVSLKSDVSINVHFGD